MYRMMMGPGWGSWETLPDYMKRMMQSYYQGTSGLWGLSGILDFVASVLWVVLLLAAIRWLWQKGGK